MKNPERYRHLRVDWVGQSSTQSITLCGVEGEDIVRVFGPSEVKAKMETLRGLGVQMDIQVRSQLN